MSDAAFDDFTEQVLSLSYDQTLVLMAKMVESLKTKRADGGRDEAVRDRERGVAQAHMSAMGEELKDDAW